LTICSEVPRKIPLRSFIQVRMHFTIVLSQSFTHTWRKLCTTIQLNFLVLFSLRTLTKKWELDTLHSPEFSVLRGFGRNCLCVTHPESTRAPYPRHNSFRMNTYEKQGAGGTPVPSPTAVLFVSLKSFSQGSPCDYDSRFRLCSSHSRALPPFPPNHRLKIDRNRCRLPLANPAATSCSR
jgi:hypothetical protein